MAAPAKPRLTNFVVTVFILLTAIKASYSLWNITTTTAPDFTYYYQAAKESTKLVVVQPIHLLPPASVIVFAPLQYLPYSLSQGLWVVLSFGCLVFIVWTVARSVGVSSVRSLFLITALSYLSFPTQFTLGMGQVNLIALAIVVSAVLLEREKKSGFAGMMLAFACLLKPELLLLFPVIVLRFRWYMLGAAICTLGAVVGLSLIFWGIDAYVIYGQRLLPLTHGLIDAGIYYNQSLTGLLVRSGAISAWVPVTLMLGIFAISCYQIWKNRKTFAETVWMYFPAFILIEPIAWQHHFVFLLPAYILLWVRHASLGRRLLLATSYFLVSWNFASSQFLDTIPLGWLVASHGTIGALLLWILTL